MFFIQSKQMFLIEQSFVVKKKKIIFKMASKKVRSLKDNSSH